MIEKEDKNTDIFFWKSLPAPGKLFQPCYVGINIYIRYFLLIFNVYLSYQLPFIFYLTLIIIEIRLKIKNKYEDGNSIIIPVILLFYYFYG